MLRLICTKLSQKLRHKASPFSHAHLFSTSTLKPISKKLSNSNDPQSFTVSYVQNSCGLSLESAILASKKLHIENTENPDSVLDLLRTHGLTQTYIRSLISTRPVLLLVDLENTLKPNMKLLESLGFTSTRLAKMLSKEPSVLESDANTLVEFFRAHGFSDNQIQTLIMKRPQLHLYNVQKVFKPKLDYFKSLGFPDLEIAKLLSNEPYILERSLENQIIPCIQVLKRILGTDENVLKAVKACYRIVESNLENDLQPNISMLMSHGVPHSLVMKLLLIDPKALLVKTYKFSEVIGEVKKLGFDPNNFLFVLAIRSMALMSKTLWEQKVEAYRSFGLSKDEIYSAFKLQPMYMMVSERKIRKFMGFLVNKLNMKPSIISKNPNLVLLSLEKRVIPRCSVLQLLLSKGLIKEITSIAYVFTRTEKMFVERFVSKYCNEVPDVVRAHQGMIEFQGFPIELKM